MIHFCLGLTHDEVFMKAEAKLEKESDGIWRMNTKNTYGARDNGSYYESTRVCVKYCPFCGNKLEG